MVPFNLKQLVETKIDKQRQQDLRKARRSLRRFVAQSFGCKVAYRLTFIDGEAVAVYDGIWFGLNDGVFVMAWKVCQSCHSQISVPRWTEDWEKLLCVINQPDLCASCSRSY